jgi:hypothetical protein
VLAAETEVSVRGMQREQRRCTAPDCCSWDRRVKKSERRGYVLEEPASGQQKEDEHCDETRDDEEARDAE